MNEGWETVYIFWKKEISMVQHFLTIGIILNFKLKEMLETETV